jgi:hypothetical protein
VLLVAAFVASVGNGVGTGTGTAADGRTGLVGFLGRRFGSAPAVAAADVQADCRQPDGRFVIDRGICVLQVAARKGRVRSLVLRTDVPVTVTARVPRQDTTATTEVKPAGEARIAVDERGDDVTVTCGPGRTCVLTMESS